MILFVNYVMFIYFKVDKYDFEVIYYTRHHILIKQLQERKTKKKKREI